jgi:hypothetical protein
LTLKNDANLACSTSVSIIVFFTNSNLILKSLVSSLNLFYYNKNTREKASSFFVAQIQLLLKKNCFLKESIKNKYINIIKIRLYEHKLKVDKNE